MKKFCLFFIICLIFVFAGCGGSKNDEKTENPDSEEASVTDNDAADSGNSKTDEDNADIEPAGDTDTASGEDTDSGDKTPDNDADSADTSMPAQETTSCTDDGVEGKLTICTGGVCQTEDCPGSNSCKNSLECGECQNYTMECHESVSGYGVYQCQTGSFKLIKECDLGCNKEWNDCGIIECSDGDTKCVNGSDGRGETYSCVDNRWERDKDWYENEIKCAGSCNRQGTDCGESDCIDYTMECRDDLLTDSTNGGAIAQCQYGKWQIMRTCTDGSSCNRENGGCGECKNGTTKCEDHEVSGIMNKNCNSSGNCDSDSGGNTMYYSATIGVKLLCYDGRWSDYNDLTKSSYCPAVNNTFQSYEYGQGLIDWSTAMTKVYRSATTYDDYHYSSCHNTDAVSECGSCNNNFRVCRDENPSRPYGRIMQCYNGVLVTGSSCSNGNQLCKDRSQCK